MNLIKHLRMYCCLWGGDLVVLDKSKFAKLFLCNEPYYHRMYVRRDNDQFDTAPAAEWHGVHWSSKRVFVAEDEGHANGIIHEMGHVFAAIDKPDYADEYTFLGFEIRLAASIGQYRQWSRGNYDYGLFSGRWGCASARHKSAEARNVIEIGIDAGNINASTLAPQAVR